MLLLADLHQQHQMYAHFISIFNIRFGKDKAYKNNNSNKKKRVKENKKEEEEEGEEAKRRQKNQTTETENPKQNKFTDDGLLSEFTLA